MIDENANLHHHEVDPYAHGEALNEIRKDIGGLKQWRWFITGALSLLGFQLTILGVFFGFKVGVL